MPYLTQLANVLRAAGLPVREIPGWQTRGHGAMGQVVGVLCHHTAGPAAGAYPSERVVVQGRTGLAGPLANLGLDRDGVWIAVAAGQAWHAGSGSAAFCPAGQGNSRLIGVEAESVGTRDDWTPRQRASYPRGVAALLRHLRLPASRAIGHKEWAPSRKIDPAFWGMASFRSDVARWLGVAPRSPAPAPAPSTARPAPAPREDQMNAEQNRLLVELYNQMITGPDPGRWGWDAWDGGSRRADGAPDRFTVVDYLRKANQAQEDLRRELAEVRRELAARPAAAPIDYAALARELLRAAAS